MLCTYLRQNLLARESFHKNFGGRFCASRWRLFSARMRKGMKSSILIFSEPVSSQIKKAKLNNCLFIYQKYRAIILSQRRCTEVKEYYPPSDPRQMVVNDLFRVISYLLMLRFEYNTLMGHIE